MAFLSFLYDFKRPSAMGPMQQARVLYVPTKHGTIVLPVNHILGKVQLMRLYLGGSCTPTIPHSFIRRQRCPNLSQTMQTIQTNFRAKIPTFETR